MGEGRPVPWGPLSVVREEENKVWADQKLWLIRKEMQFEMIEDNFRRKQSCS